MKTVQFTLCAAQRKWLIAACLEKSGLLRPALENGRVLFKGSSTVSCLTRLLGGPPLRLCGRISRSGARGAREDGDGAHLLLCERGEWRNVDEEIGEILPALGPEDLFVTGANAIDAHGHAAMLIGGAGGGAYGKVLPYIYAGGIRTLILTASDKLIPGNLDELYPQVSPKKCSFSYGMGCGLMPVPGEIITETQALSLFADVKALILAAGGYTGAEDSVLIQAWGGAEAIQAVLDLVEQVKQYPEENLMTPGSEAECAFPSANCARHKSCCYKRNGRGAAKI